MAKYKVLVDFNGTIEYEVESDSFDSAYKEVVAKHQRRKLLPRSDVYEENFYVEDERGIQEEF